MAEEIKHPLMMTAGERTARKSAIAARMSAIQAELAVKLADETHPKFPRAVFPDLENEWSKLDTERMLIEKLQAES